ncbi:hypothetical protein GF366_03680 [Candidatus Peregrinibacteria bacterium]|nr:hypothetical protein [Candidatus Peregrinibacteria bacterium]
MSPLENPKNRNNTPKDPRIKRLIYLKNRSTQQTEYPNIPPKLYKYLTTEITPDQASIICDIFLRILGILETRTQKPDDIKECLEVLKNILGKWRAIDLLRWAGVYININGKVSRKFIDHNQTEQGKTPLNLIVTNIRTKLYFLLVTIQYSGEGDVPPLAIDQTKV